MGIITKREVLRWMNQASDSDLQKKLLDCQQRLRSGLLLKYESKEAQWLERKIQQEQQARLEVRRLL